jgi:hypothetical protein
LAATPAHDAAPWHTAATFDIPFTVTASRLVFDDPVFSFGRQSTPAHDVAALHATAVFDSPFTVTASPRILDGPFFWSVDASPQRRCLARNGGF